MRIAIARHTAARCGGTETYLETIAPALSARGHEVATWYEQGALPGTARAATTGEQWAAEGRPDSAIPDVVRWRPDVMYVNGIRSLHIEARLVAIAPAVLFAHSYLGTCISGTKAHAFPRATICTRAFGPACLAVYYPRRCGGLSPVTMWRDYRRQRARRRLLESYSRILVASRHMVAEYARHGLARATRLVPLPVEEAEAVQPSSEDPAAWRLLYLGRLEWTKGPDLALNAAAIAAPKLSRPVVLTIAGSGAMAGALQATAAELERSCAGLTVRMPGWLSPDARSSVLNHTDLLLAPSRWPEPFGLSGPEAGRHGVPAVAFDAGGISDWLSDGVNGVLLRGRPHPNTLAGGIVECLSDLQRLARMREGSRRAAGRFTMEAHVHELAAILAEAAAEARGGAATP